MMALATRYEVSTQVTSSTVAERFPAMCGRDTFTTVVSSTSMKVQNITEMAMIQGLTCLCSGMRAEHFQDTVLRAQTLGCAKSLCNGPIKGDRADRVENLSYCDCSKEFRI